MTIRETVKKFIANTLPGNSPFDVDQLIVQHGNGNSFWRTDTGDQPILNNDQIRRALRDLPHVKRVNRRYVIKGRRVPQ